MSAKLYRDAVKVLKPSKARMAAIHAVDRDINHMARLVVEKMLNETSESATSLYRKACAARSNDESKLQTAIRVTLLGLARKENFK